MLLGSFQNFEFNFSVLLVYQGCWLNKIICAPLDAKPGAGDLLLGLYCKAIFNGSGSNHKLKVIFLCHESVLNDVQL